AELGPVDVVDGTELLDQLALLRRGDDADGVGPSGSTELDREDAEATGRPPDQHPVPRLQATFVDQHAVSGEVGEAVGGRLNPGEVLRARMQLVRLHLAELSEGAPGRLIPPGLDRGRGGG